MEKLARRIRVEYHAANRSAFDHQRQLFVWAVMIRESRRAAFMTITVMIAMLQHTEMQTVM
jgi:hypothetical protein